MNKNKTTNILLIILILIITIGTIAISITLVKLNHTTPLTLEQAINDVNKKYPEKKYTIKELNFNNYNGGANTAQINNKIWLLVFFENGKNITYLDNNHIITEL